MRIRRAIPKEELAVEEFLNQLWKELRYDWKNMINWLLFYKPKDKWDKMLHIGEVVFVWLIFTKVFFGI